MAQATRHKQSHRSAAAQIEQRLREAVLIVFTTLAVYLALVLASYHNSDPGWSHTDADAPIANLGGHAGAIIADTVLHAFGYGAYLLPVLAAWAGWLIFRGVRHKDNVLLWVLGVRWSGLLLTGVALCALLALHVIGASIPISAGGAVGKVVGSVAVNQLGLLGATLVLLALIVVGTSFLTGISWLTVMDRLGHAVYRIVHRLRHFIEGAPDATTEPFPTEPPLDESATVTAGTGATPPTPMPTDSDPPESYPTHRSVDAPAGPAETNRQRDPARSEPRLDFPATALPTNPIPVAADRFNAIADAMDSFDAPEPDETPLHTGEHSDPDGFDPTFDAIPAVHSAEQTPSSVQHSVTQATPLARRRDEVSLDQDKEPEDDAGSVFERVLLNADQPSLDHSNGPDDDIVDDVASTSPANNADQSERPPVEQTANTHQEGMSSPPSLAPAATPDLPAELAPSVELPAKATFAKDNEEAAPPLRSRPVARPPIDLLNRAPQHQPAYSAEDLAAISRQVEAKLADFGVVVKVVDVHPGPVITRFELDPAPGLKSAKISNLYKDLARALSVISVRVVEVIPGKSTIGLEIPNSTRETVYLSDVLTSDAYHNSKSPLTIALGKDISGVPQVADLGKMPHLLVAGTTGSGKSVAINAMLLTLLYKSLPDQVRLILIDPKMLELSIYEGIPHLLAPVVTDMKDAANALRWAVAEMERRYKLMSLLGVRNIAGFNNKVEAAQTRGESLLDPTFFDADNTDSPAGTPTLETLPYIVIVVDEFADLMMVVGKKVEELIARLAQKARAAGIHLILATQRPSVDVITGLIKANIPSRIAFKVSSKVDSRTILDQMGAETLLGYGDMLFVPPGTSLPDRLHGAFVGDDEVHQVADYLKSFGPPDYVDDILEEPADGLDVIPGLEPADADGESDPLYDDAVAIVTRDRKPTISYVQRRLKIGYNRAARLIEEMELAGIVSGVQSSGGRDVLVQAPPPLGPDD